MQYEKLFTPIKIGNCEIRNRLRWHPWARWGCPTRKAAGTSAASTTTLPAPAAARGSSSPGVTFSDCKVETQSMPNCPNSTYNPVHFVRTSREMTERVHAYGSKIFLMMSAGFGRVTIPTNLGEFPPVAPSAIPHRWLDKVCRPLTVEEIHSIVKSFGDGAANAQRAGFDGVEIHAVHEGYLLDQFAISMFNLRNDAYGGPLENRLRFAREVVEEIKARCGKGFPVALRFSVKSMIKDWREGALPGEGFVEKGRDVEEGLEGRHNCWPPMATIALDTDVGHLRRLVVEPSAHVPEEGALPRVLPHGQAGRRTCPCSAPDAWTNPGMALAALENGDCDIVSLGRPLLADPGSVPGQAARRQGRGDPPLHLLPGGLHGPHTALFDDQLCRQPAGCARSAIPLTAQYASPSACSSLAAAWRAVRLRACWPSVATSRNCSKRAQNWAATCCRAARRSSRRTTWHWRAGMGRSCACWMCPYT